MRVDYCRVLFLISHTTLIYCALSYQEDFTIRTLPLKSFEFFCFCALLLSFCRTYVRDADSIESFVSMVVAGKIDIAQYLLLINSVILME